MLTYKVILTKRSEKGLAHLSPASRQRAQQVIDEYLAETPLKAIPGKTKRLRGRLAHLIQYDLSYSERMHYEVDEENKSVYVEYIGPHP